MKKILFLALFCFLFYLSYASSIGKNGAKRRCFKKVTKSTTNDNNNDHNTPKKVKVSCQSLVTEVTSSDTNEIKSSADPNNEDSSNNSDDDSSNTASFNYVDNLMIPKGTIINDNEECVTAIYNINKILKQATDSSTFEQSCDSTFDINGFTEGLNQIKTHLSSYIEDAITKCGNSKVWTGAKIHQACRTLSKTGQTICHSLVDEVYEKYDEKCLDDATLADMWEVSTWLWDQLININDGCYLKQLYNYKCSSQKDAIVHMGSNSYSLRLLCESSMNDCKWPGTYTGENAVVKCISKSIINKENIAINVLKKNGYVCEGTTNLPETVDNDSESDDDEQNSSNGIPVISNDNINTNSNADSNTNNPGSTINKNPKKSYIVSSGSEPWTNTNQIIGTIFIALFALLF